MDDELRELATRLRMARARIGINQARAAQLAGISQSALSLYEKAKREPHVLPIKRLAKVYDVSIDWILGASKVMRGYPKA